MRIMSFISFWCLYLRRMSQCQLGPLNRLEQHKKTKHVYKLQYGFKKLVMINSHHFFLFRNVFISAKANNSFGLIIYLNTGKVEMKILAQLNGRADGLVNDPHQRKLYWIVNRSTYVMLLKILIKMGIYLVNRFMVTY